MKCKSPNPIKRNHCRLKRKNPCYCRFLLSWYLKWKYMNVKDIQQKQKSFAWRFLQNKVWFTLPWVCFQKHLFGKGILEVALHRDVLCILKSVLSGLDSAWFFGNNQSLSVLLVPCNFKLSLCCYIVVVDHRGNKSWSETELCRPGLSGFLKWIRSPWSLEVRAKSICSAWLLLWHTLPCTGATWVILVPLSGLW